MQRVKHVLWRDDNVFACVVTGEDGSEKSQKRQLKRKFKIAFLSAPFFFPVYICALSSIIKDLLILLRANVELKFL